MRKGKNKLEGEEREGGVERSSLTLLVEKEKNKSEKLSISNGLSISLKKTTGEYVAHGGTFYFWQKRMPTTRDGKLQRANEDKKNNN